MLRQSPSLRRSNATLLVHENSDGQHKDTDDDMYEARIIAARLTESIIESTGSAHAVNRALSFSDDSNDEYHANGTEKRARDNEVKDSGANEDSESESKQKRQRTALIQETVETNRELAAAQQQLAHKALGFFLTHSDPVITFHRGFTDTLAARQVNWSTWVRQQPFFCRNVSVVLGGITVRLCHESMIRLDEARVAAALVYAFARECESGNDAFIELQILLHWSVTGSRTVAITGAVCDRLGHDMETNFVRAGLSATFQRVLSVLYSGMMLIQCVHRPSTKADKLDDFKNEIIEALDQHNFHVEFDETASAIAVKIKYPNFLQDCPYISGSCAAHGFDEPVAKYTHLFMNDQ